VARSWRSAAQQVRPAATATPSTSKADRNCCTEEVPHGRSPRPGPAGVPDPARRLLVLGDYGDYFDVALRDFGLSLAALALARLAEAFPAGSAVLRPAAADRQRA